MKHRVLVLESEGAKAGRVSAYLETAIEGRKDAEFPVLAAIRPNSCKGAGE